MWKNSLGSGSSFMTWFFCSFGNHSYGNAVLIKLMAENWELSDIAIKKSKMARNLSSYFFLFLQFFESKKVKWSSKSQKHSNF